MAVEYGIYCLGCCWALMLILFAGGVVNLAVIVALAALPSAALAATPAASLESSGDTGWILVSAALVLLMTLPGLGLPVGTILHPSPANPGANRAWEATVEAQLADLGLWPP